MQLSVGDKLGPYEILAPLGAGGMGEVWKARDTRLNRIVAIKRLIGRHSARFEQEARAIAALNHPNICQIHDIGPDYLVLEYIEGQPLRGPLPVPEAVRLAIQIAGALEEAHAKGILHRDLKPANIVLTARRDSKLLDFGLAKLTDGADEAATKTIEGTMLGTAAYMSPEQARAQALDERSDIFSFGAVLYEMFSGRRAFPGEHALPTLGAVIHRDPDPLQAPPDIVRIVTRCLRKSPEERFQRAAEIRIALETANLTLAAKDPPSIAVLPFANMSASKDDEYFSDGLAEEILNLLAHIPELKVTARTSSFAFRGKELDITAIANALKVRTILEGSVRRAGNRIRVTAQLINAADGYHLWSERYDRELADIFAVQDEIASAIAKALHVKLAPKSEAARYQPYPAAHEAFLRGRAICFFKASQTFAARSIWNKPSLWIRTTPSRMPISACTISSSTSTDSALCARWRP
jgi:serine/threonine protein kinase